MTDEQWEIVNELRMLALGHGGPCCAKAANEIERLAEIERRLDEKNRKLKKSLHHLSSARESDMGTAE